MTTVYRIEDSEGRGMYYYRNTRNPISYEPARHPVPGCDSLLMASGFPLYGSQHLNYGFISIEQLRSWIYRDEWLLGLHELGYVLAVIESDEVYVGNTQAVFLRPEVYTKHSILEYFNL